MFIYEYVSTLSQLDLIGCFLEVLLLAFFSFVVIQNNKPYKLRPIDITREISASEKASIQRNHKIKSIINALGMNKADSNNEIKLIELLNDMELSHDEFIHNIFDHDLKKRPKIAEFEISLLNKL